MVTWFKATGWRHVVGLLALAFALFPLLFVISASLNPGGTLTGSNTLFSTVDFENYDKLFSDPLNPYGKWFVNTMIVGLYHRGRHGVPRARAPRTRSRGSASAVAAPGCSRCCSCRCSAAARVRRDLLAADRVAGDLPRARAQQQARASSWSTSAARSA
jgi:hypothetical protein